MSPADLLIWQRQLQAASLTLAARVVGLALSLHVNVKTGACYPSKACLAADTGLSEETIRRAVGALSQAGLIQVEFSQGRLSNRYRLVALNGREANPLASVEVSNPLASEPPRQRGSTPSLESVNPLASVYRKEQKKEQKKEQSLLSGLRPTGEGRVPLSQVEDLMAHLNAKAGTRFEVRTATGKLTSGAESARQRIAEHGLDRLKAVIDAKAIEWLGTERAIYLRPATLFRKSNCENYVGQIGIKPPSGNGTRPPGGGPEPAGAAYRPFQFD